MEAWSIWWMCAILRAPMRTPACPRRPWPVIGRTRCRPSPPPTSPWASPLTENSNLGLRIARMAGGVVLGGESNLLAFGAILRHDLTVAAESEIVEGSRTTAAIESSKFGCVLKISEDGLVSFYRYRERVWEI